MPRFSFRSACSAGALFAVLQFVQPAHASVITSFGDLPLAPESYFVGNSSGVMDPYGNHLQTFSSGGVQFENSFNTDYSSWAAFGYSNQTDNTTPGYGNQYSSFAGSGRGDANYGIGYVAEFISTYPTMTLAAGSVLSGAWVTNMTYTALTVLNGDPGFMVDPFQQGDYLELIARGYNSAGDLLESASFMLADYRSANAADHYVVDDWQFFDMSALGAAGAEVIRFEMVSTDVGPFGSNTPLFFAIDDITVQDLAATPEPGSLLFGSIALGGAYLRLRRQRNRASKQVSAES